MRKVLLMGNPNVGKSVVFSRLTGVNVISSNYPGTTVEFSKGYMRIGKEKVEVVDGERPNQPVLRVRIKYIGKRRERQSVLTGLERVSRPGRRIYTKKQDIPWVLSGIGIAILSTPKGVMTGQKARSLGVGGELLCKIW